jgi:Domain of unknown function (DUF4157)
MERRFGHDFSQVRVHTDAQSAASARAVGALAYTVGQQVVFGAGQYGPGTASGQRLLAHELAHVVQQRSGAASVHASLTIAPSADGSEQEAAQTAEAVIRENARPRGTPTANRVQFVPRYTSDSSLQRQPCNRADDKIVTGPLPQVLPSIKCEPSPETLATVRIAQPDALGITQPLMESGQNITFEELRERPGSRCRATVHRFSTLSFPRFMYVRAGTYDDSTEVTEAHRPCPEGRVIAKKLLISPPAASKLRLGEIEHCEDSKLAFALSLGKYNQAVKDLEGEYCAAGRTGQKICRPEFAQRFKERTGIEYDKQQDIAECLLKKSLLRDHDPRRWHDIPSDDHFYAKDCSSVTYILSAGPPNIGNHPPAEIVKGCGE